eukprot:CAMPEP_0118896158 /NCGR_PEP_ID=MMETSP1166-20130328/4162_1 /TAXON_ID=1104430 /ORGANISM="Chrysoreinhardia sp, Strain CCMP3193" /LENGTH=614 /DNA_ID=CAMNT_0006835211 /DNA_START=20 /DNA_END=1864 /DNA_ORIENTATION=+
MAPRASLLGVVVSSVLSRSAGEYVAFLVLVAVAEVCVVPRLRRTRTVAQGEVSHFPVATPGTEVKAEGPPSPKEGAPPIETSTPTSTSASASQQPEFAALGFPLAMATHLFGGGIAGEIDLNLVARGLEGAAARSPKLRSGRDELRALLTVVAEAFASQRTLTRAEASRSLEAAARIERAANEAFPAVKLRSQKVTAVSMAIVAIAVRGSIDQDDEEDFVAVRLQEQVDKLTRHESVISAVAAQTRGQWTPFRATQKREREAFLRQVLAVIAQEIFYLRRRGRTRKAPRPLLPADDQVRELEFACCGVYATGRPLEGVVSLYRRNMFAGGASKFADALATISLTPVRSLDLRDNSIGDAAASKLAAVLKRTSTVRSLYLENNHIGPDGALKVASLLSAAGGTGGRLKALYFGSNRLGDDGARQLAQGLAAASTTLTTLYLERNNVGDLGAASLADALAQQQNQTLTSLVLWENKIGDLGAAKLAEALHTNTSLASLYLGSNYVGADGAEALAKALGEKHNSTLATLDLANGYCGDLGAASLADALKQNTTLTHLSLQNNLIGDDGAANLADALEQSSATLISLHLEDNYIRSKHLKRKIAALLAQRHDDAPATN